ncbi:hypothetical protein [Rubellicoccus peritrichatus]|uniref:Uncharacterized protein n=1 Tax=Rubellicoccus peritrichatus TaxID=3080537 RepID=A0AAQ3L7Q9_9BACT|nr:hypothetical protein [Puniceicoccus sp. CR14]WOO40626.1 hypothetical protein RZN69_18545 [Puniceicoccus sp. CR14]
MALFLLGEPIAEGAEGRTITFRTLCFRHQDDVKEVKALGPDGQSLIPVKLYTTYSLPERMMLRDNQAIFVMEDGLSADGVSPKFRVVARTTVPSSVSQVLFVFLPAEKNASEPYKLIALQDDPKAFPYGNVRLLNLSPVPVRFHLGEQAGAKAKTVKPGGIEMVDRVQQVDDYNMYQVRIEFQGRKGFVPISSTRWKAADRKRDLAITYFDPDTKRPLVNVYKDVPPAAIP